MTQNLVISGKEYRPSAVIAQSFGYTPDYVSRLAREGKIVATNVNRKWFINQESFKEFVRNAEVGKEERSDELKKQRKAEQLLHSLHATHAAPQDRSQSHIALAQSMAVLMCGAFVGLLGWSVTGEDITVADLSGGFENTYTQIADAIRPTQNPFSSFANWSGVAAVQESFTEEGFLQEDVTHAVVPDNPPTAPHNDDAAKQYDSRNFSDEIDVRFVDDGTGVVRPIFKSEKDGQEYQVLLAPVTPGG